MPRSVASIQYPIIITLLDDSSITLLDGSPITLLDYSPITLLDESSTTVLDDASLNGVLMTLPSPVLGASGQRGREP